MSAGEQGSQVLEIPGKPTVWRTTDLPPRRIDLPYLGQMPRWRMLSVLLLGIPLIPLAFILAPVILIDAAWAVNEAPFEFIKVLFGLVIAVSLLVLGSEAILIALRGALHRSYHVGFDAEKFWHFQLSDPIAFGNIKRLEIFQHYGSPEALRITTDQPFRLQFRSLFNRRLLSQGANAARFTFSARMVSGNTVLLTDALGHLVEANGGIVEHKEVGFLWLEILWPWF